MAEQEKDFLRKSIDTLFNRVNDLEMSHVTGGGVVAGYGVEQNHGSMELEIMRGIEDRILQQIEALTSEKVRLAEQRVTLAVETQGKDIAIDFTELERRMQEFREQVELAVTEITTAIIKLNQGSNGQENSEPAINTHTSNLFT